MQDARRDGFILLLLGALAFLSFGFCLERFSPIHMVDFGVVYFPTRCLLQHGDPYNPNDVLPVFEAQQGDRIWDRLQPRRCMTCLGYPPSAFPVLALFAMLPWNPAHLLWMVLVAGSVLFSACLTWSLCADRAPVLAGALIGFFLANCQAVVVVGNVAGITVGLCVIAAWCFLRDRYVLAGVVSLALSLALKPHIAWIVWLYFLLAGGVYRKRALQTFGITVLLCLTAVLWVRWAAPNWYSEMRANQTWLFSPGGQFDPGLKSGESHGLDMLVNLQTIVSVFRDDPRIYQPVAYGVGALLLLIWAIVAIRSHGAPGRAWMALASASALSMLPFYHHIHDAKLILLAVPACVQLWAEGRQIGRVAVAVTAIAFFCTGDLVWTFALIALQHWPAASGWFGSHLFVALQVFPAPLAILVLGVFYLWVFASLPQDRALRMEQEGR